VMLPQIMLLMLPDLIVWFLVSLSTLRKVYLGVFHGLNFKITQKFHT